MFRSSLRRGAVAVTMLTLVSGCAVDRVAAPPGPVEVTPMHMTLRHLPHPERKVVAAVYRYPDLTGQFKPTDTITSYSRAVSQGGAAILIKALTDAGNGAWFTVAEREGLDFLLKERAIIRETREMFLGPDGRKLPPPPPLVYAGIMLDGGIVGYDSNTLTGGAGARYLGIGGNVEYREDTVTVSLRAISTQTGEVLKVVTAKKTILSYGISANVFRFIGFRDLLEVEAGLTENEPGVVALQQAIEQAVYAMIVEGSMSNLWKFQDPAEGQKVVDHYMLAQAATIDPQRVQEMQQAEPAKVKSEQGERDRAERDAPARGQKGSSGSPLAMHEASEPYGSFQVARASEHAGGQ